MKIEFENPIRLFGEVTKFEAAATVVEVEIIGIVMFLV